MRHRDFVQHLEGFKSYMIDLLLAPKPAKDVQNVTEILSDDTVIKNCPWHLLKHTIESATFDLKTFTVSFDHFD